MKCVLLISTDVGPSKITSFIKSIERPSLILKSLVLLRTVAPTVYGTSHDINKRTVQKCMCVCGFQVTWSLPQPAVFIEEGEAAAVQSPLHLGQ